MTRHPRASEKLVVWSFDAGGSSELDAAGTHSLVCLTARAGPVETGTCA